MVGGLAAPTLSDNTCIENSYAGISYGQDASGIAANNDCSSNGFAGINLEGNAKPTLEGNSCNQNGKDDFGIGIAYFKNSAGTAQGNTVTENLVDLRK